MALFTHRTVNNHEKKTKKKKPAKFIEGFSAWPRADMLADIFTRSADVKPSRC